MAVNLKTDSEIETMKAGGKILAGVMEELKKAALVGVKTIDLDKLAEKLILEAGCEISFRTVRDYQWTTCMCVNDTVVHGIPNDYVLKEGDLLGIDVGLIKDGLHLDMAETIKVQSDDDKDKFLEIGKKALEEAIKVARVGNRIGHISETIERIVEGAGFKVVHNLVGHGVGRVLHEGPSIPLFLEGTIEETLALEKGMTLAIEVIYNQGQADFYHAPDGWTLKTKDGSLSATFERTIAVTDGEPIVLTALV